MYGLELLYLRSKKVEAKSQNIIRVIPIFVELTGEKLEGGTFLPPNPE